MKVSNLYKSSIKYSKLRSHTQIKIINRDFNYTLKRKHLKESEQNMILS